MGDGGEARRTLANSLGVPLNPRPRRRHGERHTLAAEAVRCCSCGQALRHKPIDAWGRVRKALADGPMTLREIVAATGLPMSNASMAIVHHGYELDREGKRGSYRYSLKASA